MYGNNLYYGLDYSLLNLVRFSIVNFTMWRIFVCGFF